MTKEERRAAIATEVVRLLGEERTRRRISKNTLATLTGLNQSTMSRFERSAQNPTLDSLLRVADALQLDLGDVIKRAAKNVESSKNCSQ